MTSPPAAASSEHSDSRSESSQSSFTAPLDEQFPTPSIDGTAYAASDSSLNLPGIRKESPDEVTDDERAEGLKIKSDANKLYLASKYVDALALYTQSLNCNPFDSAVWCNRAAVRLKMEEHGLAIFDASKAIELNPKYVKAYFRRAIANLSIVQPKKALVDFKKVMQLDPNNTVAKSQMDSTQKLVRRMDFEKAIAGKDEVLVSSRCRDLMRDGMAIETSYTGPKLPSDDQITPKYIDEMLQWFKDGKVIARRDAWSIVLGAFEAFKREESLVDVTIPEGETAHVIGDTHGQFFDLLHLLELTGKPSETHSMVFNGDFVDRGSWSTEVVLTLFAYKWLYPHKVFLNRGNHETSDMNKVYGMEGETKKKYSELTYKLFEEVFCALPLATLVSASVPPKSSNTVDSRLPKNPTLHQSMRRYFITHGGLFSSDSVTLDDVRKIERMKIKQPGQSGLMCELLWTDPQDQPGRGPSKRGVGLGFGPDVTKRWTEANEITAVIRSHEVRQEGYSIEHNGLCITVFSAPNYVDQVGNLAGIIKLSDDGNITFQTFSAQPHPDIKPMAYAGSGFSMLNGMM